MCSEIQFVNFVIEILNRGTFPLTEHGDHFGLQQGQTVYTFAISLQRGVAGSLRGRGQGERVSPIIVLGGGFIRR